MDLATLSSIDAEYGGYLEGPAVDAFFKDYGVRFAAGHWCAGEFFDRFCPAGYNSDNPAFDNSLSAQIARVRQAGIDGIEFHESCFIDAHRARDGALVEGARQALAKYSVVPTNMNFNTWSDPKWKFGGVTHPDAGVRAE